MPLLLVAASTFAALRWAKLRCAGLDWASRFRLLLANPNITIDSPSLRPLACLFYTRFFGLMPVSLPEGVGKSSLISTFVSRYFSEVVPGIMTRVRLPPDPTTSCVTTIVDSQGGDAALLNAMTGAMLRDMPSTDSLAALMEQAATSATSTSQPPNIPVVLRSSGAIENVDSIVLVYDLDRVETFFRLENHWLPLIERCYAGKVRVWM